MNDTFLVGEENWKYEELKKKEVNIDSKLSDILKLDLIPLKYRLSCIVNRFRANEKLPPGLCIEVYNLSRNKVIDILRLATHSQILKASFRASHQTSEIS